MRRAASRLIGVITALSAAGAGGCAFTPAPSGPFITPSRQVDAEWKRLRAEPTTLDRPLVVLDGWRQFEWSSHQMAGTLRELTGASRREVMPLSFPMMSDLDAMAESVIKAVERRWPSEDPQRTIEVDVVAHSMGGLVARLAASPRTDGPSKRLDIANLYTIATPHRGTVGIARLLPIDRAARDMLPGSERLADLDNALEAADYKLVCYAQLNDQIVGARNAAPPGYEPIWTEGTLLMSHYFSRHNKRILTDIALRLRGEPPLVEHGSAPPRN